MQLLTYSLAYLYYVISLVRQLNFYNFRKINRERTFWVYYHPMFHRDKPENMHLLKRRSTGTDGRKNRAPSPPSAPISYDYIEERPSPNKVSRSPSPASSPENQPRLSKVVSEESLSAESEDDIVEISSSNAEKYVADKLNKHIIKKKLRKAKHTWSDSEEYSSPYTSSTRKNNVVMGSGEEQEHLQVVADVSRHLNDIAASHSKPGGTRGTYQVSPTFGLDKPHDHYFGAGKCDLFTYDCDNGYVIDEDENNGHGKEKKKQTIVTPNKIVNEEVLTVPSDDAVLNQSLIQACMEGKVVNRSTIITECARTAAAILGFCLSTHPQDPDLAKKVYNHLQKVPFLAKEFDLYYKAMIPGESQTSLVYGEYANKGFQSCDSEDLKRHWKVFCKNNLINRVSSGSALNESQQEAVNRCVICWSSYL